ncbi:MAG: hypothetical protein NVV73_00395 [Cellvibrionaceae bacterium]|nr:hypothetical protein [Cellvibrionaceae bacterium]
MADVSQVYTSASVEEAVQQLEVQAVNFAYRFIQDARVRTEYMRSTKEMAEQIRDLYGKGQLTAQQAAETANAMRNEIMEFARVRSSDLGKAKARSLKAKGLDLDDLLNKYAKSIYKKPFDQLTSDEASRVYLEVVDAAGRSRPSVNIKTARLANAGKALWLLSACVAIYNVSVANNKVKAAGREAAGIGGGFGGGAAGGAVAGIWFGPIGVAIGVVVGGTLGAIMADQVYVEVTGADGEFARKFIAKYTNLVSTDESAMADALVRECSYEMQKVLDVFVELEDKYSTDADDIALLYVEKIRALPLNPTKMAFQKSEELKGYLKQLLESGWTSAREREAISYLTK